MLLPVREISNTILMNHIEVTCLCLFVSHALSTIVSVTKLLLLVSAGTKQMLMKTCSVVSHRL